jgi:DNA-binding response OmpR family regulator
LNQNIKGANQVAEDKKIEIGKSNSRRGKGTILIVDDDYYIRQAFRKFLNSKGFVAHAVSVAEEALAILKEIEVDLVITDLNMPGMDGLELTRLIKERTSSHVIIMTGYREGCSQEDAHCVGADDLIYKPVALIELLIRINRIFNLGLTGCVTRL